MNKKDKTRKFILAVALGIVLAVPLLTISGGDVFGFDVWVDPNRPVEEVTIESATNTIFQSAFWILVTLSSLLFLLGAFYLLTGGQKPEYQEKGKQVITFAIIGLILAFLASGITRFITGIFGA